MTLNLFLDPYTRSLLFNGHCPGPHYYVFTFTFYWRIPTKVVRVRFGGGEQCLNNRCAVEVEHSLTSFLNDQQFKRSQQKLSVGEQEFQGLISVDSGV